MQKILSSVKSIAFLMAALFVVLQGLNGALAQSANGNPANGNASDDPNPYSPRFGHPYRHGVTPTREQHELMRVWAKSRAAQGNTIDTGKLTPAEAKALLTASTTGTLSYHGGIDGIGVTSSTPVVYLVFWGNQWGSASTDANTGLVSFSNDTKKAAPYMQKWLSGLGTSGELWSGVVTQYCDGSVASGSTSCPLGSSHISYPSANGVLAGIWYDDSSAAPSQATGQQLAQEAIKAAIKFGNTTNGSNRYVQYIIMSPSGTHPDGFGLSGSGFCAWHDYNGDTTLSGGAAAWPYPYSGGDVAFTNMPYVADLGTSCGASLIPAAIPSDSALEGFSIVGGHEYAETVTDQNPGGGWYNNSNGQENADECAWITSGQGAAGLIAMSTGSFAMQSSWSNDTNRCDLTHPVVTNTGGTPTASFTYTTSGSTVAFKDTSTDTGGAIGSYSWNFGDNTTSTAQSPSHTYTATGNYTVVEKVTDSVSGASSQSSALVAVTVPTALNVITNGGFESSGTGWTLSTNVICPSNSSLCTGLQPHSGTYLAKLDGYGTSHTDTVSQKVAIPSGKTSATLAFWYQINTKETTTSKVYDKLAVQIVSGTTTYSLGTLSNLNAASNYQQKTFSLNSFIGKTVTLKFVGTEDSSLATSFLIDDVSLIVQ